MSADQTSIDELPIPADEHAPQWPDFVAATVVINSSEQLDLGSDDFNWTPDQHAAQARPTPYRETRLWLARRREEIVGVATYEREFGHQSAWIHVLVAGSERGQGVGSALLDELVGRARTDGLTIAQSTTLHSDLASTPRLTSPTGHGDIPADAPGVRFARSAGFELAQVELISALPLPVDPALLERLGRECRPAPDYELVSWTDPMPEELLDQYSRLRTVMSTAAPAGELAEEEQHWDGARVRDQERQLAESGQLAVTTAVRHRPSGELVGFTKIRYDRPGRPANQGYTLVIPEHRGHSLGMRLKLQNLRVLAERAPEHHFPKIITGNAGENDAMLSINRALGFRPQYAFGHWQRTLDQS